RGYMAWQLVTYVHHAGGFAGLSAALNAECGLMCVSAGRWIFIFWELYVFYRYGASLYLGAVRCR
ncbi:MAG: hypothetical protein ACRCXH_13795, partial [Shewanella sp.]